MTHKARNIGKTGPVNSPELDPTTAQLYLKSEGTSTATWTSNNPDPNHQIKKCQVNCCIILENPIRKSTS
jgi:hypothetical protein